MQDTKRISQLLDKARDQQIVKTDSHLAQLLGVSPKVLSNWRTGHKSPSLEMQCEIAAIAGVNVPITALLSMIENADGTRKQRFQNAYQSFVRTTTANVQNL